MQDHLRDVPPEQVLAVELEYTEEDQQLDHVVDDAANETHGPVTFSISSYGADYTVDTLVKRMTSRAFFIPAFQRSYVWTQRQASRFLESLLLGLPVPGVFVCKEDSSARHLIIDGQQRLKTLQMFYEGAFRERVFRLIDVQQPWTGRTYKSLTDDDRQRLDDAIIHTTVFKPDDPEDVSSVFHVFERLNTSGVKLQPQEIRNCIYYGKLIDTLERLNDNPDWRSIYGRKNDRLKDREMILRFLAFSDDLSGYKRPMKDFLNNFVAKYRNTPKDVCDKFTKSFADTISVARSALGEKAFRPERFLNTAVFDAVMIGLSRRLEVGPLRDPSCIASRYAELLEKKDFRNAYLRSTADEENVAVRMRLAVEAFRSWKAIHAPIAQLDALFGKVPPTSDAELQAHWAQYLCIRCAGLLEHAVVSMMTAYCTGKSSTELERYIHRQLKRFQNPDHEKIAQLFASFDPLWSEKIEEFWRDKHKSSIASIVNNRHLIAHGKSTDITLGRLSGWYKDEKEVIDFLYAVLFPKPPVGRINPASRTRAQ